MADINTKAHVFVRDRFICHCCGSRIDHSYGVKLLQWRGSNALYKCPNFRLALLNGSNSGPRMPMISHPSGEIWVRVYGFIEARSAFAVL